MKRMSLAVTFAVLGLTAAWATPARSLEQVDPALVGAAEKMLATMPADYYQVEPAAAQQQLENVKPLLLDVREPSEVAATGSIPGAVHIPIRELPKSIAKLPASKTAPILTYCKSGYRGGMSVTILRMWGYTNVRTIKGGIEGWEKAKLPVAKAQKS